MVDAADLGYDLDAHHLGLIVQGPGATEAVRDLAAMLDRRPLVIHPADVAAWAWLGGRRPLDPAELDRALAGGWPESTALALGEPSWGIQGWRLTHQQARAAMPVALRGPRSCVRYSNVTLLASMLQDDLLVTSLRKLYMEPLEAERDGGKVLRKTLRAYFRADRNISATASALDLSRRTIANRLRRAETRIGRSIRTASIDLEAALDLENLDPPIPP